MASAQLIERHPNVVDLSVRSRPGIQSYVFGGAVSLDAAYAGTTAMFTVARGRTFRSPTLRRNRVNLVGERSYGLTRASYDPVDYASATIPGDNLISFLRVAEVDNAGTTLPEGPILVIPPPAFFVAGRANLTLNGTAPDVAGLANDIPPLEEGSTGAMWIDIPKFATAITFHNDGAAPLAVAFGHGRQEFLIPPGEVKTFPQSGVSLVGLRGEGGATAFRATLALVNGLLA
jgi:hypothetical protein